jgi:hypothetical protein
MAATPEADPQIDAPELDAEEVRRRFAWARRQGRPAWLWPDVPIEAWREALKALERVIAALFAGAPVAPLDGDAETVGLAAYTSGVGPLLGLWLEQGRLQASDAVAATLARHLRHNRLRAARMETAGARIVARLADGGIKTLVLKGAHTGPAYFPEPGTRPASDIDLLVDAGDVPAAEAVMQACGFALGGRNPWESNWTAPSARREPRSLTYVHAEDPWSVDLHHALKISVGRGAPLADFDLARPLASWGRWPVDPRAGVLDQPLLLLHLAAHAGAGWHSLTLLRQVELVLVIRQDAAAGRLDWAAFGEMGVRTGALGYAYPALRLADQLAPGLVPPDVLSLCAGRTPKGVRRALERLTPATAQRIERNSLGEHFMWAQGWRGGLLQIASDILLSDRPWPEFRRVYEERAWRLIRGRVSQ